MFLNSKLAQLANREVQGPQFREFTFWSCEVLQFTTYLDACLQVDLDVED